LHFSVGVGPVGQDTPEQSPSRREAGDAGKDIALAPVTPAEVIAMFQRMAAAIPPEAQRYAYWLWDGEKFVRDPFDIAFNAAFDAAVIEVFGPSEA